MKLIFALLASLWIFPAAASDETLRHERVAALHDPVLPGLIKTYYTPGYERRASALQHMCDDELQFAKRVWNVNLQLSVAVLDVKQWIVAEPYIPYPVPSLIDTPPMALIAADWTQGDSLFPPEATIGPAIKKLIAAHNATWTRASGLAGDLFGEHEVGHAVIAAYGIPLGNGTHWLDEMLATYVMVAFISEVHPDQTWVLDVQQTFGGDAPQHYSSLDDFESNYEELGAKDGQNYAWYQSRFLEQARRIYASKGTGFVKAVRAQFPPGAKLYGLGNAETLRRIEKIYPGFGDWATKLAGELHNGG